ncbi:MAG: DmsC/YnfH family molybdoenzyme membrane anchor subunit [Isosphaeraceae bacterium]
MSLVEERVSTASVRNGSASRDLAAGEDLIGSLLFEQGDLTAVERFAQYHQEVEQPLQSRYYRALLPTSPPGPGQQLAFEVDLDRCSGCKACVAACHSLNGLDDDEAWRDVGLLVGGSISLPVLQHVTTACHHCLEPACLDACPVEAYEKDPVTGIVKHLDDQCFGCQYCTLACPYDVPKFHPDKGIVRKCDMCSDRLQAGEAPACVQACPHEAIRIRVVDRQDVIARAEAGEFLPAAFDPSYTMPTTVFRSLRPGELRPADEYLLKPEHNHMPLVVMLVLTQLSVGGFLVELIARLAGRAEGIGSPAHLWVCLGLGFMGLGASLLHLGRPLYAYRAILGWRHSWLSREVVTLGLFAKLAAAFMAAQLFAPAWLMDRPGFRTGLLATVVMAGLSGVGSSVMVYHVVRREFWRASSAGIKFAGTAVVLGLATALACLASARIGPGNQATPTSAMPAIACFLAMASILKLWFEAGDRREPDWSTPLGQTARLLRGPLKRVVGCRRFLGVTGGLVLPALAVVGAIGRDGGVAGSSAFLALAACLAGELLERSLFFTAVAKRKMPGVFRS